MSIDLTAFETLAPSAVRAFWAPRASVSNEDEGGSRRDAPSSEGMGGFQRIIREITVANGLPAESVHPSIEEGGRGATLPGFYRPLEEWDSLVLWRGELVAAVALKSQVGSGLADRAGEAIRMAENLRGAYRSGLLGDTARPFVGYLMLLDDSPGATRPVGLGSHHFDADPVFDGASYAERYRTMCTRLMREGLYDSAALVLSEPRSGESGTYRELSEPTSLRAFCARLAARVSEVASR